MSTGLTTSAYYPRQFCRSDLMRRMAPPPLTISKLMRRIDALRRLNQLPLPRINLLYLSLIFRTTFILTANSTHILKILVASSFNPVIVSFIFLSGMSPVFFTVSSAVIMNLLFPDTRQCLSNAMQRRSTDPL